MRTQQPGDPDDELRARLARLDPIGDRPVDPRSSPRAAEHVERAMTAVRPTPSDRRVPDPDLAAPPRRLSPRRIAVAGAAALAAAAAVTTGVVVWGGDDGPPSAAAPAGEPTTLTLTLPGSDATASCLPFEVAYLADMSPAFAGTAVEVGEDQVVLDVDRWYAGGDADRVRLETRGGAAAAALGSGVAFEPGQRYLVTAAQGTVNGCGYSGPATPELEQAFESAFGG